MQDVVNDRPKPMAEIKDRPFLDLIIEHVASFGFKRFILCTGHKSTYIADYYKNQKDDLTYITSEEISPLGTAGALANAKSQIKSNPVLILNGDSYCPANLKNLIKFHFSKKAATTIVLTKLKNAQDFGMVTINKQEQVTGFNEKPVTSEPGIINAGIYVFNLDVIDTIPVGHPFSLETELFPALIMQGNVYGFASHKKLIDIGTPERLEEAKKLLN